MLYHFRLLVPGILRFVGALGFLSGVILFFMELVDDEATAYDVVLDLGAAASSLVVIGFAAVFEAAEKYLSQFRDNKPQQPAEE